jgi:hypothetical protein
MKTPLRIASPPPEPQRYCVSTDIVSRRLGDDIVIVHLQTNQIYSLNYTAARLWELLSEGYDVPQIKQQLLSEFDIGEMQLAQEMAALISSLLTHRLISAHGGP